MRDEKSSWEYEGCREEDGANPHGYRACHLTCNTCITPDDSGRCIDCELVTHCSEALNRIKNSEVERGHYFQGQLTGEESLYHVLRFVNVHQNRVREIGRQKYVKLLEDEPTGPQP